MIGLAFAAAIALPPQWNAWQHAASIAPARARNLTFTVPPAMQALAAADLSDLRIAAGGREVPYTIQIRRGSTGAAWTDTVLDDYGYVAGAYTQVTAAVPRGAGDFSRVEISTPRRGFAAVVDVDASDDRTVWRAIKRSAPIYENQAEGLGSNSVIAIAPTHSRYVRLRLLQRSGAFPIDAVRVQIGSQTPAELVRYTLGSTVLSAAGTQTQAAVDTGTAHLPVSMIRVQTTTARFARGATVESSDDGASWQTVLADARIERSPNAQQLALTFDETQARYWRVRIENGNDAALTGVQLHLWGTPRHVIFSGAGAAAPIAVFGNPAAQRPSYDFEQVQTPAALAAAAPVRLGPVQANAGYAAPRQPWSETHSWILWVALGAAVMVFGAIALRVFVTEGKQAPEGASETSPPDGGS